MPGPELATATLVLCSLFVFPYQEQLEMVWTPRAMAGLTPVQQQISAPPWVNGPTCPALVMPLLLGPFNEWYFIPSISGDGTRKKESLCFQQEGIWGKCPSSTRLQLGRKKLVTADHQGQKHLCDPKQERARAVNGDWRVRLGAESSAGGNHCFNSYLRHNSTHILQACHLGCFSLS